MMNQRPLNIEYIYKEEKIVEAYYQDLFEKNSVFVKLFAIDYLAPYISDKRHREKFESLCQRETNHVVKNTLKSVLNGEYIPLGEHKPIISDEEYEKTIAELEKEYTAKKINENNLSSSQIHFLKNSIKNIRRR